MKRGKGPQKGAQGRMQRFLKETGRRIFFLPPLPVLLIAVPAFGLVIYVLTAQIDGLPAYLSYLTSAYPLYDRITKKRREKLAPEIMRLTDELMK